MGFCWAWVMLLAAAVDGASRAANAIAGPPPGYNWMPIPLLTDEFNTWDSTKWSNHNPDGWQGRLPGWFDPGNVKVANGTLQLWAHNANITDPSLKKMGYANFTTSAVQSLATVRYGYFELRAKVGSSKVSSSFWFYHNNGSEWTEIDVFEMTGSASPLGTQDAMHTHVFLLPNATTAQLPARCNCTEPSTKDDGWDKVGNGVHVTSPMPSRPWHSGAVLKDAVSCTQAAYTHRPTSSPYTDDFHTFGLLWTPDKLVFTVDGVTQWEMANVCMHQALTMNFDRETMPDWFGLPATSNLPDSPFTIDYIHSWRDPVWNLA